MKRSLGMFGSFCVLAALALLKDGIVNSITDASFYVNADFSEVDSIEAQETSRRLEETETVTSQYQDPTTYVYESDKEVNGTEVFGTPNFFKWTYDNEETAYTNYVL